MAKDTDIIQFVGFVTRLTPEEFMSDWEHHSQQLMTVQHAAVLHCQGAGKRFRYLSKHKLAEQGLSFAFMKNRSSRYFREQRVKVVEIGGYISVESGFDNPEDDFASRIIAFVGHSETDIDYYRGLVPENTLNIYQEYYENCMYGYVLEFLINDEAEGNNLLTLLTARAGIEAAVYHQSILEKA